MFNRRKITATTSGLIIATILGISAIVAIAASNGTPLFEKRAELTAEQRAEFETRRKAWDDKWATLTNEQKNEIYALKDQIMDLQGKVADKYAEFGVISAEELAAQKERMTTRKSQMREKGEMPMRGLGGMKHWFKANSEVPKS